MLPTMALCFHAGVHHLGIIRQFAPETLITDHHSFQASTNVYLFGACCNRNSTLQRNAMGKLCRALQVAAMLLNGKNRWNCFGTRLRYRYVMVCLYGESANARVKNNQRKSISVAHGKR